MRDSPAGWVVGRIAVLAGAGDVSTTAISWTLKDRTTPPQQPPLGALDAHAADQRERPDAQRRCAGRGRGVVDAAAAQEAEARDLDADAAGDGDADAADQRDLRQRDGGGV